MIKQLLREFWLPFLLAGAWSVYNALAIVDPKTPGWAVFVKNFGPSFFLLSWMTGQWFRVKKQSGVESRLDQIAGRIEKAANDVTGGDSYCFCVLMKPNDSGKSKIMFFNNGKHPLYELGVRMFDAIDRNRVNKSGHDPNSYINIGNLPAGQTAALTPEWDASDGQDIRLDIHYAARNGEFHQQLIVLRPGGKWLFGMRVVRDGDTLQDTWDTEIVDWPGWWELKPPRKFLSPN
jgi:hypothetical protein